MSATSSSFSTSNLFSSPKRHGEDLSTGVKTQQLRLPDKSRPALAGMVGGSLATLLLHPLDLLKTRQAVHCNGSDAAARERYSRLRVAVREIVKREGGLRGLYGGVGANVLVSGSSWGLYFMSYGFIKSQLQDGSDHRNLGAAEQLCAAIGAGVFTTVVSNPLSVVRTRMIVNTTSATKTPSVGAGCSSTVASVARAVTLIARTEGLKGLYKGLWPSILGVSHGAIQFVAYEQIKMWMAAKKNNKKPSTSETLAACTLSKVLAAVLTYPCQNIRACQQASLSSSSSSKDVTALSIVRREGARGLYRGMLPYLMHVVPNVCLVFMVYEAVAAAGN